MDQEIIRLCALYGSMVTTLSYDGDHYPRKRKVTAYSKVHRRLSKSCTDLYVRHAFLLDSLSPPFLFSFLSLFFSLQSLSLLFRAANWISAQDRFNFKSKVNDDSV